MKLQALTLAGAVFVTGTALAAVTFESLDKDSDGNVSQTEAKTAKNLSAKFDQYDVDKDKVLSQQEFSVFQQQQQARAGKVSEFKTLDKDGDGNLSQTEARNEKGLRKKFGQYDVDKDKVISEQEYQAYQQQEQLRRGQGGGGGKQQGQGQQGQGSGGRGSRAQESQSGGMQ